SQNAVDILADMLWHNFDWRFIRMGGKGVRNIHLFELAATTEISDRSILLCPGASRKGILLSFAESRRLLWAAFLTGCIVVPFKHEPVCRIECGPLFVLREGRREGRSDCRVA